MSRLYSGLRRWRAHVATISAAAILALVPLPAPLVERWYSANLYPAIERTVTSVTNLIPYAVLDLLIVVSAGWVVVVMVRAVRQARRERALAPVGRAMFKLATAAAATYVVFVVIWGLNYRRVRMEDRLALEPGVAQGEQVLALGLEAVQQLNRLHTAVHSTGWTSLEWQSAALTSSAARVHRELAGVGPVVPGRLKTSAVGVYFRWTGVDGMVNPFGLEVLGNPDLLPFERPSVAAHEWAHLAGFANEAEANFVAFLTCVRSAPPDQYSGWLSLYWQIANEVDSASRTQLWNEMDAGPRGDVAAVIARLRRGELPRLRTASWLVYDQYLKANRVESGVRNYGEVVNLLVRGRFETGWVPVLRR